MSIQSHDGRDAVSFDRHLVLYISVWFCALIAAVALPVWTGRRLLEKAVPLWTGPEFAVTGICLVTAGAVGAAHLRLLANGQTDTSISGDPAAWRFAWFVSLVLMALAAILLIAMPGNSAWLVEELAPISMAQAVLIAFSFLLFVHLCVTLRDSAEPRVFGLSPFLQTGAMAIVVGVLLMEEISWGQHFSGWSTPELFSANLQNETNLHNFHTHKFELVYYGAAFFAFVALPLLRPAIERIGLGAICWLVPPPAFAILALPVVGYMFTAWSIVALQMLFFAGLAMAVAQAAGWSGDLRRMAWITIIALVALQLLFFVNGERLDKVFVADELRELHIAFALVLYTVWLWRKARRQHGVQGCQSKLG